MFEKIWQKSTESENLIESRGNWIGLVVEVAKSLGRQSFDDMTALDIQQLLVKEESGEGGLIKIMSGIHHNSENNNIDEDKKV